MTHDIIVPAIVRAAQRAPTPAGLASLRAALTGSPLRSAQGAELVWDDDPLDLPLALAAPRPAGNVPHPHDRGLPDPALDWMFQPRQTRDNPPARAAARRD